MPLLEKRTLKELFQRSIKEFKDDIANAYVGEEPLTYGEIGETVLNIQKALRKKKIKKGDRIAILSENGPRWGMAYLAASTMGAISVPILPDFHKSEVHHILRNSGSKIIFISEKLAHKLNDSEFRELELVIAIDDKELELDEGFKVEKFSDIVKLGAESDDKEKIPDVEEDDLAEILYTSGTTGHSKGVMLTHKNIVSNALSAIRMIDVNANDRFLSILPMSHSYECTCGFIAPFLMGCKVFYIKGLPTAQTLLPAVKEVKPTIILSVPLVMDKIYKKKVLGEIKSKAFSKALFNFKPTQGLVFKIAGKKLYEAFGGALRFMVFGGAATPIDVEIFLTKGGFPYITGYGLTEAAPLLTVNPVGKVKLQSAGVTVPEVQLRISNPDPETGVGEILANGPNIMKGYYRNEEATKAAFTDDGWLITGDRGYIDEDGYLFIKGRSKNIIVGPSGENIFPEEIEFHFTQNPFVLEALVYEKDGKIVARVHLDYDAIDKEFSRNGIDESEASKRIKELLEKIRKEVNSKVSAYSRVHQVIEQQEEFIKTPTKKIKRYLYTN